MLCVGLLAVVGCVPARQFGAGFRDRGLEMAGDIAADELAEVVDKRLGEDFKEVKDILNQLPSQLPKKGPVEEGLMYSLGGLLAYVVGSIGKGYIRKSKDKHA